MFLMFRLNRPDVFPVGDLGIVKGVQTLLGMKRRPKPSTMLRAAETWRRIDRWRPGTCGDYSRHPTRVRRRNRRAAGKKGSEYLLAQRAPPR
jgi:hypothetical protein